MIAAAINAADRDASFLLIRRIDRYTLKSRTGRSGEKPSGTRALRPASVGASCARVRMRPPYSRSVKTQSDKPEIVATYCLPFTEYVIGPLTICAPRFAVQHTVPLRA